ncbi:MAG: preprotein translocase subunit SecA [Bacteroidales bacterium]|nr:preprotein translocase subunit SecA [Bacteroidales bacterium]
MAIQINTILRRFFGSKSERDIREILPVVEKIRVEFDALQGISNDALREKTRELRIHVKESIKPAEDEITAIKEKIENEDLDIELVEDLYKKIEEVEKDIIKTLENVLNEILPVAFAIVKETARRFVENEYLEATATDHDKNLAASRESIKIHDDKVRWYNTWIAGGNPIKWDMVHYDVQLIGGVVLHEGKISEMATGEGKTLVATLPVFLNAMAGRGVHIVTVNDYLSKRDSEWMGPVYEFHGLVVDCIDKHQPNSEARRKAYLADITYGTNNEFGFDYLRDNMAISPHDLVQRKHHYAIVDEVDSVLIDDARTPLIISGPVPRGENQEFEELKPRVEKLVNAQRNLVNSILAEAKKLIGEEKFEEGGFKLLQAFKGLPKNKALIKFLSEQGNKALLLKTENFYMQENSKNMFKVTDELYFVIEEKLNSVEMTEKGIDMMTTSAEDANFFIMPDIGSEIAELEKSGLSIEEKLTRKDKLLQDYATKSDRIHTINQLLKAYAMFEKDVEYVVIDNKVKIVDEQTGRILEGRRYSDGLHQAIEAKEKVKVEAATQTFATITLQNYFRMYHKLAGMTGTAETEAAEFWNIYKLDVVTIPTHRKVVRDDREDLIYKTKREKYNAVIDEIVNLNNQGRPSLVGTTSVEISELLSRMLKMKGLKHNVLNAKLHQREAEIVAEAGKSGTITIATNMAGRGTDIKLTTETRGAGGLAILGTERHESRRVDRQLRGRSGRQGDPGSSQFYVSLEDDLMRLFGSERIAGVMDRMGLKEGEVIQHAWITKSIERAQKKVEENNFGIRKRLLEYDDVMNSQREVIYTKRRNALFGEKIQVDVANMMYDACESLSNQFHGQVGFEEFRFEVFRTLFIEPGFSASEYLKFSEREITESLYHSIREAYKRKQEAIAKQAFPVIKDVYEKQGKLYENIVVPITDGVRVYHILTNLEKAYKTHAEDLMRSYEKSIVLAIIDESWKEHLRELDDLRQSVQTATYEQKDPLLIYKFESFELFRTMIDIVNKQVVGVLLKGQIPIQDSSGVQRGQAPKRTDYSQMEANKSEYKPNAPDGGLPGKRGDEKVQPVRVEKKVGRNELCPCGSGKKYKHCHGAQSMAARI